MNLVITMKEFIGTLETDNAFDVLESLIAQNDVIYIGTAKSRGLGEVKIKLSEIRSNMSQMSVHERLSELNSKLSDLGQYFFSVTLHSDAILRDDILNFKSKVDTSDLIKTLESIIDPSCLDDFNMFSDTINGFRHHRDWLSTYLLTGWNMAWRLPKEDEIAICKGSVFLFCTDKNLRKEQIDNLSRMFAIIEQAGIGERRNEGFGKIRICDEFHLEEGPK
jgi:CRISPR-associated protein Csx10